MSAVEKELERLRTDKLTLIENIKKGEAEMKQMYANLNAFEGGIMTLEKIINDANNSTETVCSDAKECDESKECTTISEEATN